MAPRRSQLAEFWSIDCIVRHKETNGHVSYEVKWEGFDSSHNSWVSAKDITPDVLNPYKKANGIGRHKQRGRIMKSRPCSAPRRINSTLPYPTHPPMIYPTHPRMMYPTPPPKVYPTPPRMMYPTPPPMIRSKPIVIQNCTISEINIRVNGFKLKGNENKPVHTLKTEDSTLNESTITIADSTLDEQQDNVLNSMDLSIVLPKNESSLDAVLNEVDRAPENQDVVVDGTQQNVLNSTDLSIVVPENESSLDAVLNEVDRAPENQDVVVDGTQQNVLNSTDLSIVLHENESSLDAVLNEVDRAPENQDVVVDGTQQSVLNETVEENENDTTIDRILREGVLGDESADERQYSNREPLDHPWLAGDPDVLVLETVNNDGYDHYHVPLF